MFLWSISDLPRHRFLRGQSRNYCWRPCDLGFGAETHVGRLQSQQRVAGRRKSDEKAGRRTTWFYAWMYVWRFVEWHELPRCTAWYPVMIGQLLLREEPDSRPERSSSVCSRWAAPSSSRPSVRGRLKQGHAKKNNTNFVGAFCCNSTMLVFFWPNT